MNDCANMRINVIKNAKRNIIIGVLNRVILLLCPFVEKAIINQVLGPEYLGLGSLFTSIISVLSLSELGFSSAMVYNMYTPAAEGNIEKINSLLAFYKRVYRIIGAVIFALGVCVIPFLPALIRGSYPSDVNIYFIYLLYLINTSISYFMFAYLSSVIVVHQRDDINSTINSVIKIGLTIAQILILLIYKNYYYFVSIITVFTIINNVWVGVRVKSLFPQYKAEGVLDRNTIISMKKHVAGTFIQQACLVTRNSLDSICVSAFIGLTATAIYNNYFTVMNGVTQFMAIIGVAFMGGVGNHVATKTAGENFEELKKLDFVYLWIAGWCSICLLCLYQPFMKIWMGPTMMLDNLAVILFCCYFYLLKLGDMRSLYSSANGIWWEQRYRSIAETILNLILNIALGKLFGVYGIILATMISLVLCNYIWAVDTIFRLFFGRQRRKEYYKYQGKQSAYICAIAAASFFICSGITLDNTFLEIFLKAIICIIFPNACMYAAFRKTELFKNAVNTIIRRNV